MIKPNLFILGAPKCGTTSISTWLSGHPEINMASHKEPNFFNTDHVVPNRYSMKDYLALFDARNRYTYYGEATTAYLRSATAVREIMAYSPGSKFIICVRNPVDMTISLHAQRLKDGVENENDLEKAWNLTESRRNGENIPSRCLEPTEILYGDTCKVGEQIKRAMRYIHRNDIFICALDDLKSEPMSTYLSVLEFLGLQYDGRLQFQVENPAIYINPHIARMIRSLELVKHNLGIRRNLNILPKLKRLFEKDERRCEASPELLSKLEDYYEADISELEDILGKKLTSWKQIDIKPIRG